MHKAAPEAVSIITHNTMNRLSLADLKAQSNNVVDNLEAIKGGNADACHCPTQEIPVDTIKDPIDIIREWMFGPWY